LRPSSSNTCRLALFAIVVAAAGCSRSGGDAYVARVDGATLTRDAVLRMHAGTRDSAQDPRRYVNDWVVTELLYREAERRGIAESDEVKEQAELARRRVAVAALLEREIYSDTSGVTDDTVAAFYRRNAPAFALHEEVLGLSYAAFADREAANAFRSRVLAGSRWEDAVGRLQADTANRSGLLQLADHQYFTRGRLYPPELWKLALTLPRGDVSFVLKTGEGFYVLVVHRLQRPGTIPELEYVRSEVRDRLLIEHRRQHYEKFLDALRRKASVDVRLENTTPEHE
jgi:peptidyl-prolyl cis-trans isomerase C